MKSSYNIDPELKRLVEWGQIKKVHHGEYRILDPRYKLYLRLICRLEFFSTYLALELPDEKSSLDDDIELIRNLLEHVGRKVDES